MMLRIPNSTLIHVVNPHLLHPRGSARTTIDRSLSHPRLSLKALELTQGSSRFYDSPETGATRDQQTLTRSRYLRQGFPIIFASLDPRLGNSPQLVHSRLPATSSHDLLVGRRYSQIRQGSNLHHDHVWTRQDMMHTVLPTPITMCMGEACTDVQASIQVPMPMIALEFRALLPA